MDAKELRLLNRHANRVGGPNAPKGLDAGTRRACNAVHEITERRIGDMSRWSRNPADRIPATPERNYRLVRDITRSESPTAYARESTPKERATLKNALTPRGAKPRKQGQATSRRNAENSQSRRRAAPNGLRRTGQAELDEPGHRPSCAAPTERSAAPRDPRTVGSQR